MQIKRIAYYRSDPQRVPKSKIVADGEEIVEIITSGQVCLEIDDDAGYGAGTVFRHRSGEKTVQPAVPGESYECLLLVFATDRPAPERLNYWQDHHSMQSFVSEVLHSYKMSDCDAELLCRYCRVSLEFHCVTEQPEVLPTVLRKSLDYINRNLHAPLEVTELAARAKLSRTYFQALFLRYLGMSPYQYIMKQRLELARELLLDGWNIKEVSGNCGFSHLECFYRAFRRAYQITPGEFQKAASLDK